MEVNKPSRVPGEEGGKGGGRQNSVGGDEVLDGMTGAKPKPSGGNGRRIDVKNVPKRSPGPKTKGE